MWYILALLALIGSASAQHCIYGTSTLDPDGIVRCVSSYRSLSKGAIVTISVIAGVSGLLFVGAVIACCYGRRRNVSTPSTYTPSYPQAPAPSTYAPPYPQAPAPSTYAPSYPQASAPAVYSQV
jgi:hypothetical protein